MKEYLENSSKVLGILGTLFILFGLLVANFYYSAFNIDIFSYIEFSEAIMLFLNDMLPIMVTAGIIGLLFFIYITEDDRQVGFQNYRVLYILFFLPFLFIGIDLLFIYFFRDYKFLNANWYAYWFPFMKVLYIFLNARFYMTKKFQRFLLLHITGIFIVSLIITSQIKIIRILKYNHQQVHLILKNNTEIMSDSTNLFLGKTNNYFIFFNTKTKQSTLEKTESVEKIFFVNK